jgi:TorA maturation chaperone TorD
MNAIPVAMESGRTVYEAPAPEDRARADFYALIARLFAAAPDADLLAQLAQADEIATASATGFVESWNALRAAAGTYGEAAAQEYQDLFIGIGRPRVVLYGSFYLSGFMMEKPLAALRTDLVQLGLERQSKVAETEDHFAAVCEVMRLLILEEDVAPDAREQRQEQFFLCHVKPWYEPAMAAVAQDEGAKFYRCAAGFARAFLDLEVQAFEIGA